MGGVIVAGPIIYWLIRNQAFISFIEDYFIFNIEYTKYFPDGDKTAQIIDSLVFFLDHPLVLLAIIISVFCCYKQKSFFNIVLIGYEVITLYLIAISGRAYLHYGMVIVPMVAIPFAQIGSWLSQEKRKGYAALIFTYVLITIALPFWLKSTSSAFLQYSSRNDDHFRWIETTIVNYIRENSGKDDEIIVCGNWDLIYNMSERFAASKYSYQNVPCTISEERKEEFLKDLDINVPRIIVMAYNAVLKPDIEKYISKHEYELVQNYDFNGNSVDVYILRE